MTLSIEDNFKKRYGDFLIFRSMIKEDDHGSLSFLPHGRQKRADNVAIYLRNKS